MPTKVWAPGESVLSTDFNLMVQEQVIPTFATPAARDAAITAPKVGQYCFIADQHVLLQYTNKSVTPGWHKPWGDPWGWMAFYEVTPQSFGSEGWVAGGGYTFPTARRALEVRMTGWAHKAIDGNDAHCILRMVGGPTTGYTVLRDALTTLHQGWTGHIEVATVMPTDIYPEVHFRAWCSWGTYMIQWGRVAIIDVGPSPVAAKP
jgi:hypothetical protein